MESAKHINSDEETDQLPLEKFNDDNTGVGRFYECNFCKRGFTNAQALGGHMNIHRKEKAKAKQKAKKSSVSDKSNEECMSTMTPVYYEQFSSEQPEYYAVPVGGQKNYQFYIPVANPNSTLGYHLAVPTTVSLFEDHIDPNLSLKIDHHPHEEDSEDRKNNWNENELDLELRLG